jgi:2-polyprenyl-3-methyl-5-hydroxy-6-metoxy-1,4-benzoquinol methylase
VNEFDAAQFEALGPWITGFEFGGNHYGGQYRADTDSRVLRFVSTFRERLAASNRRADQPLRILECGCLEGGHTTVLAQAFPDATITAVDVRETSLQKAKFILSASGITNVRLTKENLNEPSAAFTQHYDAIFCVGLLYHLRQPAQFLARAAQAAGFLWLSTIICAEPEATVVEDHYRGRFFREAIEYPLAGVIPQSFQPTIGSLADMLWAAGFNEILLLEKSMTPASGPAVLLKAEKT